MHAKKSRYERALAQSRALGDELEVRQSIIPGAGNGLFIAKKKVERNGWITWAEGVRIPYAQAIQLRTEHKAGHVIMCERGVWALLTSTNPVAKRGGAQFANHQRGAHANARFCMIRNPMMQCVPFLQATKPIEVGEEVFCSYGSGSFRRDHFCQ